MWLSYQTKPSTPGQELLMVSHPTAIILAKFVAPFAIVAQIPHSAIAPYTQNQLKFNLEVIHN
ncbi:hypothetical protein [Limnospira fusiformis]|uniref:hypothetical protein n=1 Tax=Limnospira fusiformis TaxID=54297 RepID=UPI001449B483|nr:hypothetical protein HFV01_10065 [Limnospira fusiformis SAG 85.79]